MIHLASLSISYILLLTGGATESASITSDSSSGASEEDKDKKPKKNRCHTCKKKVGLTGKLSSMELYL